MEDPSRRRKGDWQLESRIIREDIEATWPVRTQVRAGAAGRCMEMAEDSANEEGGVGPKAGGIWVIGGLEAQPRGRGGKQERMESMDSS